LEVVILLIAVGVFFLSLLIAKRALHDRKIKQLAAMPFPDEWERILERNVALYRYLPETLREQLHNDIKIFIAEKHFEGLAG
jgi:MtfA peptidase